MSSLVYSYHVLQSQLYFVLTYPNKYFCNDCDFYCHLYVVLNFFLLFFLYKKLLLLIYELLLLCIFYQDIKLKDRMQASDSNEEKNRIREQAIDYTKRKNISIVGVKKISTPKKKKFYNIEGMIRNGFKLSRDYETLDFSYASFTDAASAGAGK